jgi:hypothetical protein
MKNENLVINFTDKTSKGEIIIRETNEVNELEIKAPIKVALSGVLGAPFEFLSKRLDQPEQINQKYCHILINREAMTITLIIWEYDEYMRGSVTEME